MAGKKRHSCSFCRLVSCARVRRFRHERKGGFGGDIHYGKVSDTGQGDQRNIGHDGLPRELQDLYVRTVPERFGNIDNGFTLDWSYVTITVKTSMVSDHMTFQRIREVHCKDRQGDLRGAAMCGRCIRLR